MTTLCNISHTEFHITDGLEDTNQGILFPYNPEFYDFASGLYGPGSWYCWSLLLASFIINWYGHPQQSDGTKRPGLSNDLLAVVALPVFAATDALVQAIRWIGTEYRALAIFCIRYPSVELQLFEVYLNRSQIDLARIPPDTLNLGQRAVDISGPLSICFVFLTVFLVIMAAYHGFPSERLRLHPSRAVNVVVYGSYIYVCVTLAILHCSLGDFAVMIVLSTYEIFTPPMIFLMWTCLVLGLLTVIFGLWRAAGALISRDSALAKVSLCLMVAGTVYAALSAIPFLITRDFLSLGPDLGIYVGERDQIATLIVGITSLCYTVADVTYRHLQFDFRSEIEAAGIQVLTGEIREN